MALGSSSSGMTTYACVMCSLFPFLLIRNICIVLFTLLPVNYPEDMYDNPHIYTVVEQLSSPTFGTVNVTTISSPRIVAPRPVFILILILTFLSTWLWFIISCKKCATSSTYKDDLEHTETVVYTLFRWMALSSFLTSVCVQFSNPYPSERNLNLSIRLPLTEQATSILVEGSRMDPSMFLPAINDAVRSSLRETLAHSTKRTYAFAVHGCIPAPYIPSICSIMKGYQGTTCTPLYLYANCLMLPNGELVRPDEETTNTPNTPNTPKPSVNTIYPDLAYIPPYIQWPFFANPAYAYGIYWIVHIMDSAVYVCTGVSGIVYYLYNKNSQKVSPT